ncbi:hypothetical protein pb186bvf_009138 [Paramecium bursaria]
MNKFLIATTMLGIVIILDIFLDQIFWKWNTTFTEDMQNNTFNGETFIFAFFSYLIVLPPAIGGILYFYTDLKIDSLLYIFTVLSGDIINSFLKNIYHQPRPYWIQSEISGLDCNTEYGKPSGHAQTSVMMIFLLQFIYYPKTQIWSADKTIRMRVKIMIFVLQCVTIFMIGLSRVYLGVHSIGQVLLGWCFGIYCVFVYEEYIHELFYNYMKSELSVLKANRFKTAVQYGTLIFIIIFSLNLGLYFINKYEFVNDEELQIWLQQIADCQGSSVSLFSKIYQNGFLQVGLISIIYSFILGCHFSDGIYQQGKSNLQNKEFKLMLYRLLCLLPLGIAALILLIPTENVFIEAYLKLTPLEFLAGFYITIIYQKILKYFNLQLEGDFLVQATQAYANINDS